VRAPRSPGRALPGPAAAGLLFALVLLSHLPLLHAGYVQDDHLVVEAPTGGAAGAPTQILTASYWEGARGGDRSLYRPVTIASFALERALAGGARPAVSHAVNLALHALLCVLLWRLTVALGVAAVPALLGAAVFAVTPAKSEAVASVVGRSEILAALFTLAAVRLSLATGPWRGARPTDAAARLASWGAAACVLLAAGSKETGLAAAPIVFLVELLRERPKTAAARIDRAGALAPVVLGIVVFGILRVLSLQAWAPVQEIPEMDNPLVAQPAAAREATALGLASRYARLSVLPYGLSVDYSGPCIAIERSPLAPRPVAGTLIFLAIAILGAAGFARSRPPLAVGGLLVLVPYLLIGNLVVPIGAIFAERFLYLPLTGAAVLLSAALARVGRGGPLVSGLAVAVLAAAMWRRAADWRSDRTIFEAALRSYPEAPRAQYWVGSLEAEDGRLDRALAHFAAASRAWPPYAPPHLDRGLALVRTGNLAGAETAFREAARLAPAWAPPRLDLALLLHRRGDLDGATVAARHAVLLDPGSAKAWAELGHLFTESGRRAQASEAYRRAIALGRTDLVPRLNEAILK